MLYSKEYFKKIILISSFCVAILASAGQSIAEAADAYTVICTDVQQYNGDTEQAAWIANAILYASSLYGVDPLLVAAVMETESHFHIQSVSSAGAIGLMQLMPGTAAAIGVDPYDPLGNVCGGAAHLRTLLDTFASWGDYAVTDAVAAYNAGVGAVETYNGCPPYAETRNYVVKVSAAYNQLLDACAQ